MKRRHFLSTSLVLAANAGHRPAAVVAQAQDTTRRRLMKMHVGSQHGPTTPEMLQFIKRHGVNHVCARLPRPERGYWTVAELEQARELCESHGVSLDMVTLPILPSSHIDRERHGAIMLGESPQRDRDIERINIMTANCAKAGIPAWKYNLSLLGVLRTESSPGRGGSSYSTWDLKKANCDLPMPRAGRVDEDTAWARITYFLDRVIPVCNENKIRAACHPHDPGVPPAKADCRKMRVRFDLPPLFRETAGDRPAASIEKGHLHEMMQVAFLRWLPPHIWEHILSRFEQSETAFDTLLILGT